MIAEDAGITQKIPAIIRMDGAATMARSSVLHVALAVYSDRDLLTLEVSEVSGMTEYSYNAHGELETSLDQRGVLTTRTLDVLDRVTQVTWSGDPSLTVAYTWDDPLVDYSLGRLTRIARNGTAVDYEYDSWYFNQGDASNKIVLLEVGCWYEPSELEGVIWEMVIAARAFP